MKIPFLLLALVASLTLIGCESRQSERSTAVGSGGYQVDTLFHHEGCTIYRFTDNLRSRYYSRCDGVQSSGVEWPESCGKNCTRNQGIETSYPPAQNNPPAR